MGSAVERISVWAIALSLVALSWVVVTFGPSAPVTGSVNSTSLLLFIAVWGVGMVAMMLPSLIPMLFLVISATKKSRDTGGGPGFAQKALQPIQFVLGYFGVWTSVGLAAYFGLTFLFRTYPPFSNSGQLLGVAGGVTVFLAGVYQFSPLKRRALQECRSPTDFVVTRWRTGAASGLLMGADYGSFCTKCCWAFMGVLALVGGMSLLWMIVFAGVILIEKVAPPGVVFSKGLGVGLMITGVAMAAIPA